MAPAVDILLTAKANKVCMGAVKVVAQLACALGFHPKARCQVRLLPLALSVYYVCGFVCTPRDSLCLSEWDDPSVGGERLD